MNAAANIYLSHNPQSQAMKAVAARYCIYNQYTSCHHHNEEGSSSRTQNNFASRAPARAISKEKRSPCATSSLVLSHLVHIIRSAREKILQVAATLFSRKISAALALSFISSGSTIATVSSENLLFPIFACGAQREKKENVASEMRKSQPCAFSFFFFRCAFLIEASEDFFPLHLIRILKSIRKIAICALAVVVFLAPECDESRERAALFICRTNFHKQ